MLWEGKDPDHPDVIMVAVYKRIRSSSHSMGEAAKEIGCTPYQLEFLLKPGKLPLEADMLRRLKRYAWPDVYGDDAKVPLLDK